MKKVLLLITVFSTAVLIAQAPTVQWQRSIGGSGAEEPQCIRQTSDGGFVMIGRTTSNDAYVTGYHGGYNDWWVVKLTAFGILEWQKALGGTGIECANSVQETSDGGFIVAGYSNSNDGDVTGNHGGIDAWVVKLSSSGNIEWQKTVGGNLDDRAVGIVQTFDGGFVVVAATNSTNGDVTDIYGGYDALVVKLSGLGSIEWKKTYGNAGWDTPTCIQQTSDGGYIMTGHTDVNFDLSQIDFWVLKLTEIGNVEWQKTLGGTFSDFAYSIKQTSDGGYIIAGDFYPSAQDPEGDWVYTDAMIMKLSSTGLVEWQKPIGGTKGETIYSIEQTVDGEYVAAGVTNSNDDDNFQYGNIDAWIVKLTGSGELKWQRRLGGTSYDMTNSIQQTSDEGYIVGAYTNSNDGDVTADFPNSNFWIVKLSPDPLSLFSSTNEKFKVYPNPTNQLLYIQDPTNEPIDKITISEITGKVVIEEVENLTQVNVQALQQGLYFIQIQSQGKAYTQKFIKE